MTRNEHEYYANINGIAKALDRIADALENNNLTAEEAHNVKHAFTGMDGKQVDEKYEAEQARLYTDDIKAQDDALNKETQEELDTHHDYLHGLVQDLDNEAYFEFCNTHCVPASDTVAVSNYITDLDYDEVLGIIKELEEVDFRENHIMCPDLDLRETTRMYTEELSAGNFNTKKECILDYITNEFGSHGARYTDIIKFAYYLGEPNAPKFGYNDRGYYSQAISGRRAHLVGGGKDFLVKGINKEGDERYFAHSFVESVTDYWKYIS